ncbi:predicted protein [Chaetomium globosum CBS 148.51]|uniref:Uncharacterized protein n=1 Tax=Chaetomium globosum (strain ATCC 6205 / CBS 148.51 / DSM 1962 / NBRC 6347 / NRRL 1970) TaxID=306901 RepID=Q2GY50_CHAGB|nr:uncharacterized protein CHGG_07104 [Chaetomium globosum CBS 148.51]EAQ85851.1 predicted protein [Chaetomium globosum CBS 148.51]
MPETAGKARKGMHVGGLRETAYQLFSQSLDIPPRLRYLEISGPGKKTNPSVIDHPEGLESGPSHYNSLVGGHPGLVPACTGFRNWGPLELQAPTRLMAGYRTMHSLPRKWLLQPPTVELLAEQNS